MAGKQQALHHRSPNEGTIFERTITRKDGTKTVRYVARLPLDAQGKRPVVGSFATKTEASQALKAAEVQRAQGTLVLGKVPTTRQWCESWLQGRPRLAYNTRRAYLTSYAAMLPFIGHIPLDRLVEADIAAMRAALATGCGPDGTPRPGGKLAATTLDKCHRHLNAALRAAARSRHVPVVYNPASFEEAKPPKGQRKRINPFTEDEVQRLFAATVPDREHPLWVVLITTGMRHGEAQALRWEDIDLDRRTVAVCASLHHDTGAGLVPGPTKTGKSRVISLRPHTVEALRWHQRVRQPEMRLKAGSLWQDTGLVFTTGTGHPLDQRRIQRLFDAACERAGVPRRTIKETRHTFPTLGLTRNVPVKIISEGLGHASVKITYDIYSHVIAGLQEDALSHLDRLFG